MTSFAGTGKHSGLRAELVREADVLRAFEPRWREAAVKAGNVFLTPDWYVQSVEAHPGLQHAVVVIRDEPGDVVALIPLVDDGRTVRFAGAAFGDRFGAVVLERGVLDHVAVWRHAGPILKRLADERLVILDRVDAFARPRVRGAMNFVESSEVLPYIPLRAFTWDNWLAGRSANFRSQIKRKQQRLTRVADTRFVEVRETADSSAALQVHFDLHYKRRESVGDQSSLASDTARRFHFGLVRRLAEQGWLRLWLLKCDDVPVASWYGWRIGFNYAYYQAGFDGVWAEYSPGLLLMIKTVAAAFEEGAGEYDLLLGDEQYKQRFTAEERRVQTTVFGRATSPSFLGAYGLAGARRVYRFLPEDVRLLTRRAVGSRLDVSLFDRVRDS